MSRTAPSLPVAAAFAAPAAAMLAYLLLAGMFVTGHTAAYQAVLSFFGMMQVTPPFLDTLAILAAMDCHAAGINVFQQNPCDIQDRPHVYGTLWLHLSQLGLQRADLTAAGLSLNLMFLAGLFALPRARGWQEVPVLILAYVSPVVVLALERANTDILVWVLVVVLTALLPGRPMARAVAYALAVLAAMLKFYPITLLALLTRETLPRALMIGVPLAVALGAMLLPEMARPLNNFRYTGYMTDAFGAQNIAQSLLAVHAGTSWQKLAIQAVTIALFLYALSLSVRMALRFQLLPQIRALPAREAWLALAGGVMLTGCFFAGPSLVYRAIHLLLVLPAILSLWRNAPDPSARVLLAGVAWVIVWCLWSEGAHNHIMQTTRGTDILGETQLTLIGVVTGLRELAWWWLISVLIALAGCIGLTSPAGSDLCRLLRIRLPG